jgi:hypothetical protein
VSKPYIIYACTHPGCSYYRDTFSTGVHAAGIEARETHDIAPVEVVPAKAPNVLSVEEARLMLRVWKADLTDEEEARIATILERLEDFAEQKGQQ